MNQLLTSPLGINVPKFKFANRVSGSQENVLDKLNFFFPTQAGNALDALAIQAAFNTNELTNGALQGPDTPDILNPNYTFGQLFNNVPVYGSIEFGNTDPKKPNPNTYTGIDGNTYTFKNIVLTNAIISVNQPTNIIKTKITGRSGTIKQIVGLDDWNIIINAVVNYPQDQAPKDFIAVLWQMKKALVPIPVTNYLLNLLDINYIIIEDIPLSQTEGGYSTQAVTITACSDIPLTNFLP